MAIEFSGEEWFDKEPAEIFAKLTDLPSLVSVFPDVDTVSVAEADQLVFRVKPGFSFVRGTLENSVRIVEKHPPQHATIEVKGKGIGMSVTVLVDLPRVAAGRPNDPTADGSLVAWKATVAEMGGLLKAVSKGLIEGAAKQVIAQAWSAFRRKILS